MKSLLWSSKLMTIQINAFLGHKSRIFGARKVPSNNINARLLLILDTVRIESFLLNSLCYYFLDEKSSNSKPPIFIGSFISKMPTFRWICQKKNLEKWQFFGAVCIHKILILLNFTKKSLTWLKTIPIWLLTMSHWSFNSGWHCMLSFFLGRNSAK